MRSAQKKRNGGNTSRTSTDVQNYPYESSSSRRQWREVWRSYGNSSSKRSENTRSNRFSWQGFSICMIRISWWKNSVVRWGFFSIISSVHIIPIKRCCCGEMIWTTVRELVAMYYWDTMSVNAWLRFVVIWPKWFFANQRALSTGI